MHDPHAHDPLRRYVDFECRLRAPQTGSVVLDGVGAQSILGGGAPSLTAIAAATSSSATRTGALTLRRRTHPERIPRALWRDAPDQRNRQVNGTLSAPSSTLDANGNFTVAATGSVDLGAGTHTFGANYTGSG